MIRRAVCVAFGLALSTIVAAAPIQVIKLRDQSVIRGEILEMKGGIYLVKTPTLGEVKVPADQVLAILSEDAAAQPAPALAPAPRDRLSQPLIVRPAEAPGIREGRKPSLNQGSKPTATTGSQATTGAGGDEGAGAVPQGDEAQKLQKDVNGRVQSMMMDGSFMEKMMGLGDSENMQSVMDDPDIMNAIQSGDYEKLMNDPKMQQLIDSPEMKEILGDVAR